MRYFLTLLIASFAVVCASNTTKTTEEVDKHQATDIEEIAEATPTYCEVVDTEELTIIYPNFSKIDLVCDEMPTQEDESVIFVAEAAYTARSLNEFTHSNIEGDHVSGGVRYKGDKCESNTGAFIYYNGTWKFCFDVYSNELDSAAKNGGAGFGQEMIIYNGEVQKTKREDNRKNHYRALCEISNKLCIVESKNIIRFADFKTLLKAQNATYAIYLDMGNPWNYAWYRTDKGIVELHKKEKNHYLCTNWITFYK